jgi:8-oxo-dGTP diphosphatase
MDGPIAVLAGRPDLSLTIYLVRSWEGDPVNRIPEEHSEIRWFDADVIQPLPLAHPALGNIVHTALAMSRNMPGA